MADLAPARELREAVAKMRQMAWAASPGPWFSWLEGRDGWGGDSFVGTEGDADLYVSVSASYHPKWEADQDYIASMHPGVALAVADWLEDIADELESVPAEALPVCHVEPALAVARAYLGSPDG